MVPNDLVDSFCYSQKNAGLKGLNRLIANGGACLQMAVAKLSEAERAKEEMEHELKHKEQELQKRTRFRFHDSRPAAAENLLLMGVSHRGPGAFARADMMWRRKDEGTPTSERNSECSSTSPPDQQVDAVATDGDSTAAGTVEAGCSACPPATEPSEAIDDTLPVSYTHLTLPTNREV